MGTGSRVVDLGIGPGTVYLLGKVNYAHATVELSFKTSKLQKDCTELKKAVRKWGKDQAGTLFLRLDQLRAAQTLADFGRLGLGRPHELKANLKGLVSVDLRGPHRLLLKPNHNPLPKTDEGGLDWAHVTRVEIIGIEDTHG